MTQALTKAARFEQVRDTLLKDNVVKHIAAAIRTPGLRADTIVANVLTYLRTHPDLLDCTQKSILQCVMTCLSIGLEPDAVTGQAYLVPYRDKREGRVAQLIVGYRGMIQLALRSSRVQSIRAEIVYPSDEFRFDPGDSMRPVTHIPDLTDEREEVTVNKVGDRWTLGGFIAAYMIGIVDGVQTPCVLRRKDVESRMRRSQAARYGSSPWQTDTEAMIRKTAVRSGSKLLPQETVLSRAITLDEQHERNEIQDLVDVTVDDLTDDTPTSDADLPGAHDE